MLQENGQAEDYLSEYMQEVYSGVFFKEFVLFFGENIQYYIMEESESGEQLTESGSLQRSDIMNDNPDSKYEIINDMMISMTLQDDDTLDHLIEESVALVGKPVPLMNKEDKVTAIQFLNDAGAFLITKSGDKVANYFGISKYTLYSYIDVNK